jgi:hypothetical protein
VRLRVALVLIVLVALAVGCSRSDSEERPAWVEVGVNQLRSSFKGNPDPVSVTWGDTADRRWVVVRFAKAHTCTACSSPHGYPRSRTNGARIEFAPGTTKVVRFNTENRSAASRDIPERWPMRASS